MKQNKEQETNFTDYSEGEAAEKKMVKEFEAEKQQFIERKVDQIRLLLKEVEELEKLGWDKETIIQEIKEKL